MTSGRGALAGILLTADLLCAPCNRVWKTFDWEAMNRLHEKGMISNPASRAKSVVFTEKGLQAAKALHEALFARSPAPRS